jgi:pimeloyl-ACP methyl ester carboxylesterase
MKNRWAFVVVSLSFVFLAATAAAHPHDRISVERRSFPVRFVDGSHQRIVGYVYRSHGTRPRNATLLLVHGGTYDHRYWDAPRIDGVDYSYARYAAAQGYTVVAIDELGAGESTAPNGDLTTVASLANAVHQVAEQIRWDRTLFGRCDQLVYIGHSLGTATTVYAQGTYHDADAIVATGWSQADLTLPVSPESLGALATAPYFAIPSELRAQLFYYPPNTDPAIIEYDNTHLANLVSRGLIFDAFTFIGDPVASRAAQVTEPVLVQLGEFDALFPAPAAAPTEVTQWTSSPDVSFAAVPAAGHDINFHLDNHVAWHQIDQWLERVLDDRRPGCRW